jgi:hypothetical protein
MTLDPDFEDFIKLLNQHDYHYICKELNKQNHDNQSPRKC